MVVIDLDNSSDEDNIIDLTHVTPKRKQPEAKEKEQQLQIQLSRLNGSPTSRANFLKFAPLIRKVYNDPRLRSVLQPPGGEHDGTQRNYSEMAANIRNHVSQLDETSQRNLPCCTSAVILSQVASIPAIPIRPQHSCASAEEERRFCGCAHIQEIHSQHSAVCLPQNLANHGQEDRIQLISNESSQCTHSSEASLVEANLIYNSTISNEKGPCMSTNAHVTPLPPVEARNSTENGKKTGDVNNDNSLVTTASKAQVG